MWLGKAQVNTAKSMSESEKPEEDVGFSVAIALEEGSVAEIDPLVANIADCLVGSSLQ